MEFQTQQFLLRRIKPQDRDQLAKIANNRKIWLNLRDQFPHPYSMQDADSYINMVIDEQPHFSFAIDLNGKFAGMIGIVGLNDVYKHTAEIGYWLGEPYWGHGIMTKACRIITKYALEDFAFTRIQAGIFEYNVASMKVLEKCGYTKECISRKSITKDAKIIDEHRYAITI